MDRDRDNQIKSKRRKRWIDVRIVTEITRSSLNGGRKVRKGKMDRCKDRANQIKYKRRKERKKGKDG